MGNNYSSTLSKNYCCQVFLFLYLIVDKKFPLRWKIDRAVDLFTHRIKLPANTINHLEQWLTRQNKLDAYISNKILSRKKSSTTIFFDFLFKYSLHSTKESHLQIQQTTSIYFLFHVYPQVDLVFSLVVMIWYCNFDDKLEDIVSFNTNKQRILILQQKRLTTRNLFVEQKRVLEVCTRHVLDIIFGRVFVRLNTFLDEFLYV